MTSLSHTPGNGLTEVPQPSDSYETRGYGNASQHDFAQENHQAVPVVPVVDNSALNRSASTASTAAYRDGTPSRSGTLKKKASLSRRSSLGRSASRRSSRAGSIRGVSGAAGSDDYNSALHTPIPTQGSPTEVLANRFQAWRTLLKSLITYFREIQSSYDTRSKAIMKVANVVGNMSHPSVFITDGGLADASRILNDYHKHSVAEANKSRDIEADVIGALTGLRSDLAQKIKEIKSLNGDFKNSVEKEKDSTRKAIDQLAEALQHADHNDSNKTDPFLVRLGVDRSIERQIDEENYLHRAYLNLESSGRELEAIVVGEIQKAYNALAGILKREGDDAYNTVEQLRGGPIAMPKDLEWSRFVETDPHFVNPKLPLRRIEDIDYSGKHSPSAAEVRAGMLERKSKYLKSYTPGWYVLSPTHLHEFKSADKIYSQPPVMSLYLLDQKLGSHSEPGSSSHKFMLKGRQSGSMHRGHSWVFRAESHETMMAWFTAIKALTEKTGEERNAFVRQHARSISQNSHRNSISSDGLDLEEDEADQVPYSAQSSVINQPIGETRPQRPVPGGRFPSDLQIPRHVTGSPSSESSDHDTVAALATGAAIAAHTDTNNVPAGVPFPGNNVNDIDSRYEDNPYRLQGVATHEPVPERQAAIPVYVAPTSTGNTAPAAVAREAPPTPDSYQPNPVDRFNPTKPAAPRNDFVQPTQTFVLPVQGQAPAHQPQPQTDTRPSSLGQPSPLAQPSNSLEPQVSPTAKRQNTNYANWMAPAAVGAGAGVLGSEAYHQQQNRDVSEVKEEPRNTVPEYEEPRDLTGGYTAMPTSTEAAAPASDFATNNGISGATTMMGTAPFPIVPANSSTVPRSEQIKAYHADSYIGGSGSGSDHGSKVHETGALFPKVLRHDTDMSISQLHVPGEFPDPRTGATASEATMMDDGYKTGKNGEFVAPSAWDMARE